MRSQKGKNNNTASTHREERAPSLMGVITITLSRGSERAGKGAAFALSLLFLLSFPRSFQPYRLDVFEVRLRYETMNSLWIPPDSFLVYRCRHEDVGM